MRAVIALASALAVAACATTPDVASLPAAVVTASGETEPVGSANQDAADDPAIWRNPDDPRKSLIVATDKKAGLHVYGLDGKRRSFVDAGLVNNVDLVTLGDGTIVVGASDRNDPAHAKVRIFTLDPQTAQLQARGIWPVGPGEGYGFCMRAADTGVLVYSVLKDGTISEARITLAGQGSYEQLRTMKLATQPEGCVVDPRDGTLYVGEEDRGIWRFAPGAIDGELVAQADGKQLVADVEGLAIMPQGTDGGLLVASSQGDNAYALYRLPGMEPAGRFRIGKGAYGATQETDGIDLRPGDFGPGYPNGLFVAQDGDNAPYAQNFKLVSWQAILDAVDTRATEPADGGP